jgi:hypothetical protein
MKMRTDDPQFAELVASERVPSRDEIAALLRRFLAGTVDETTVDRLERQLRELLNDRDRARAEQSAFRGNGRRYQGQAWKEVLSPHERLPSPAELALWLAIVTRGYPPPRPFCPPELCGTWQQTASDARWEFAPDGAFSTTEPRISRLGVVRWCIHLSAARRADLVQELWLLRDTPHNISPRRLVILECSPQQLRLLRPGGDFGDTQYELTRAA